MTDSPLNPVPENDHEVGFFERRWRMLKAGVKKMFSYLFDIKSYIYAGVMFGGAALLGTSGTEFGEGVANLFGVGDGTSTSILMGMGRAVLMGTLMNAGIAMVKESNECNNCHPHHIQPPSPPQHQAAHATDVQPMQFVEKGMNAMLKTSGYDVSLNDIMAPQLPSQPHTPPAQRGMANSQTPPRG